MCPDVPQIPPVWLSVNQTPPLFLARTNYVGVADSHYRFFDCTHGDTDYNYDGNGMLFNAWAVRVDHVYDGTSNTLMVGEGTGNLWKASNQSSYIDHSAWRTFIMN